MEKVYMKVTPTVVIWDGQSDGSIERIDEEKEEDDVWEELEDAESDEERTEKKKIRTK